MVKSFLKHQQAESHLFLHSHGFVYIFIHSFPLFPPNLILIQRLAACIIGRIQHSSDKFLVPWLLRKNVSVYFNFLNLIYSMIYLTLSSFDFSFSQFFSSTMGDVTIYKESSLMSIFVNFHSELIFFCFFKSS